MEHVTEGSEIGGRAYGNKYRDRRAMADNCQWKPIWVYEDDNP